MIDIGWHVWKSKFYQLIWLKLKEKKIEKLLTCWVCVIMPEADIRILHCLFTEVHFDILLHL